MKIGIPLLLFILFVKISFSQNQNWGQQNGIVGKISGIIIDEKTKQPVEFASVVLMKNKGVKIVNGTITDSKGYFKMENVPVGSYSLAITFVGYGKKNIDSVRTTPEKPDLNLGKIVITPSVTEIKEVIVEADAVVFENKVDRLVYNAEKDRTSKGGDASDVLQKVPMVTVDIDGNVSLRGSSNIKILFNGKPSGMLASNVTEALKMIPADEIKSVEVITNPSAKYDAEGTAGIINIITKRKDIQGINGSVNAGISSRRNNLDGSLSVKKGRFGINSSVGGNFNFLRSGETHYYRKDTYSNFTRELKQDGIFTPQRLSGNASLGFDYDFNAYNNIASNVKFGKRGFNRESEVKVQLTDTSYTEYNRTSTNPSFNTSIDWNFDYRRTFRKPKKEFSISLLFTQEMKEEKYTLEQDGTFPKNEESVNDGTNREYTLQTDYALPLDSSFILEAGGKGILRNIGSETSTEYFFIDNITTDNFYYDQSVYAGYSVLTFKIKKFDFKPGIRYEYTGNVGTYPDSIVKNNYDNWIPSATVAYTFKNFSSVRLSYSKRLQRPGTRNLNPYINANDPRNISYGNPELSPEISHSFELNYSAFSAKTSGNASLFYRHTDNVIQDITFVDANGISNTTFDNIGQNDAYGISLFGQVVFFKKLTIRGNTNVFYIVQQGDYNSENFSNDGVQYNTNLNASLQLSKGWSGEFFGMFNSQKVTLQGKIPSMSFFNFGISKEVLKKKGTVGVKVFNPFKRDYEFKTELRGENFEQENINAIPFRSFGISFSYKFGKLEFKTPSMKKKKGINNDDIKKDEGEGM